jgi:hypothetical protein
MWNSRGWTYQECVLSRKCFFFTEYQSYFKCHRTTFEEDLGFQDVLNSRSSSGVLRDNYLFADNMEPLQRYACTVEEYAPRTLPYPSAIEAAFSGVSNILAKDMDSAFVLGLPEPYRPQCLLWTTAGPASRRQSSPEYPSWTWMGWICPIHYSSRPLTSPYSRLFNFGTLVTFHLNHPQRGRFDEIFDPSDFQHPMLPKLEGGQRHNYRTNSKELWSMTPQNPWTAAAHGTIDNESRHIAEKIPNCLVFNTTSAYFTLEPKETIKECDYDFLTSKPYLEELLKEHEELNAPIDLTIYDDNKTNVGRVQGVDRMWVRKDVASDKKYEIIALSAGLYGRKVRKYPALADESPWFLNIMLIERRENIAKRVGIGFLYPECCEQANPQWKTIMLT